MQNLSSVNVEEFTSIIERSFNEGGERYLLTALENLRKGKLENLPLIISALQYIPDDWMEKNAEKLINSFKTLPENTIDPFVALLGRLIPSPHLRAEGHGIIKNIIVPRVSKGCSHDTLMRIVAAIDLELITGSSINRIAEASWKVGIEEAVLLHSKLKGDLWDKIEEHKFNDELEKHQALLASIKYGSIQMDKVIQYITKIGGVKENGITGLDYEERIKYYDKIILTEQLFQQIINVFGLTIAPVSNKILQIVLQHFALIVQLPPSASSSVLTTIQCLLMNVKGVLFNQISVLLPLLLEFVKKYKSSDRYYPILIQVKSIINIINEENRPFLNKQDVEVLQELLQNF